MIYIYTSILNGWDNLRPPAVVSDQARYICFTNVPQLPRVDPWEIRPAYAIGAACRTARVPKILPHLMLPSDAEYSIYHDGNFQLRLRPEEMIESLLGARDWAAHRHPCRNCIYQEASVLVREKIGTEALVLDEIARYRTLGHPEVGGLWANGLLVRRHTPAVAALNERWWSLYASGCERDQLSFPVARRSLGLEIQTIDAQVYQSPYMNFYWHAAWKDKPASVAYAVERARVRGALSRLREVAGPAANLSYPEY